MRGGSGVVTSPGYPGNYGNQADCTWILLAEPGDTISVIFTDFQTEEKYDYLEVEGSEPPTIWWVTLFIHSVMFVSPGYCAVEQRENMDVAELSVYLCQILYFRFHNHLWIAIEG